MLLPPPLTMAEVIAVCNRSGYADPQWRELAPHAGMRRFLIYDAALPQEPDTPSQHVLDSTGQYQFCFDRRTENLNDVGLQGGTGSDGFSDQGGTPPDLEQGAT